nr:MULTISPECIES: YaeP family protein [unclassified Erwinia]
MQYDYQLIRRTGSEVTSNATGNKPARPEHPLSAPGTIAANSELHFSIRERAACAAKTYW